MSILRRVEDEYQKLDPPPDDNMFFFQKVLDKLSPDELSEWRRQCNWVVDHVPDYGSLDAAIDAFEEKFPDAL